MGFTDKHYNKIDYLPKSIKYHLAGNSIIVPILEAIFKELIDGGITKEELKELNESAGCFNCKVKMGELK